MKVMEDVHHLQTNNAKGAVNGLGFTLASSADRQSLGLLQMLQPGTSDGW